MTSLWKIRKRNVFSSVLVLAMAKHNKMFHGTLSRLTCRQETDLEFVKHQHINVLLYLKIKTNRLSPRHPAAEGTNGGGGWFVHSINILCSSKAGCHAYEQKKIEREKNSAISLRSFVRSKNHARANARYHAPRSKPEHTKNARNTYFHI